MTHLFHGMLLRLAQTTNFAFPNEKCLRPFCSQLPCAGPLMLRRKRREQKESLDKVIKCVPIVFRDPAVHTAAALQYISLVLPTFCNFRVVPRPCHSAIVQVNIGSSCKCVRGRDCDRNVWAWWGCETNEWDASYARPLHTKQFTPTTTSIFVDGLVHMSTQIACP
jgi:hypothetical protein